MYHYITHDTAITEAESESVIITSDTPYLPLKGELWGAYCEDFGENWPRYNGTALYCRHVEGPCCQTITQINGTLMCTEYSCEILHICMSFLHINMTQVVEILHVILK